MQDSVKSAVRRYNMLYAGASVTVALSGGADSVALLHCLLLLRDEFDITVSAAHLNHCLRGEESDRDEQFVRELCQSLNVPLACERADVLSVSENEGLSIELAARKVRYEFLERVSGGLIATAHTASDNIETVLHNMARGTGLKGICGIPPKRDRFIRPLINVTRNEIELYCEQNELQYCTDSTNSDEKYTRNHIRHSVVPKLRGVNAQAVKNTSLMCEALRDDADFLDSCTAEAILKIQKDDGLSSDGLLQLHPAIRSRCVAKMYREKVGLTPEHRHIESVLELLEQGGRVSVQADFVAEVKNGTLRFLPLPKGEALPSILVEDLPFEVDGLKIYTLSHDKFQNFTKFNNLLLNNALDYGKICGKLTLRGRMPQDKISLLGRNCTKTLKKLFNEAKVDEYVREKLLVLADANGVLWVQGFGVDQRVAITDETEIVLVIDV